MVKKNLMINESSCMQTQILRYGGNRGRERGQRARLYKRGRGRGCYGSWYRQDQDDSKVTCYRCDKLRHYMSNCPGKLLKFQETVEKKDDDTQEADNLVLHEIVYLNGQKVKTSSFDIDQDSTYLWYLDNRASNHMSGYRLFFFDLDETIKGMVKFGDDIHIEIKGKGSVRFLLKNGDRKVLNNVYFIPSLKSNIISLRQVREAGCEVHMKNDHQIL